MVPCLLEALFFLLIVTLWNSRIPNNVKITVNNVLHPKRCNGIKLISLILSVSYRRESLTRGGFYVWYLYRQSPLLYLYYFLATCIWHCRSPQVALKNPNTRLKKDQNQSKTSEKHKKSGNALKPIRQKSGNSWKPCKHIELQKTCISQKPKNTECFQKSKLSRKHKTHNHRPITQWTQRNEVIRAPEKCV